MANPTNTTPASGNAGEGVKKFLTSVFNGLSIPANQHPFYTEALKLGAIGNVVSGIVGIVFSYLSVMVLKAIFAGSLYAVGGVNLFPAAYTTYSFNVGSTVISLFWAAVYGAIRILILIRWINRYWPKFLGKTLFAKLFYLNFIVGVLLGGILSVLTAIFMPIISVSLLLLIIGGVVASYASAKIIAGGLEKKYPAVLAEVIK